MEEQVGALWHRLITQAADRRYPQAAVPLEDVRQTVGILFRALGGDGGLAVEADEATDHSARRRFLQRIAGSGRRVELAWRDERALRLPTVIDSFADPALNRDLYLWLATLAVGAGAEDGPSDWLRRNQDLSRQALTRFPGVRPRYERLVHAHLSQRPDPSRLPPPEAACEIVVRTALLEPGSQQELPPTRRQPHPVPLWLHPDPPLSTAGGSSPDCDLQERPSSKQEDLEGRRRRGERVEMPEKDQGLVTIRMENILTFGEYVKVDPGTDEEDDLERARTAAEDMDRIAVARDRKASGARLRFDLDLPAEAEDDLVLSEGVLLPEWTWKPICALRRTAVPVPPLVATASIASSAAALAICLRGCLSYMPGSLPDGRGAGCGRQRCASEKTGSHLLCLRAKPPYR